MKTAGIAILFVLAMAAAGCQDKKEWFTASKSKTQPAATPDAESLPLYRAGTVGQYASFEGAANVRVSGYGIVVGLGNKGSSEIPPNVEAYLKEYLLKKGVGSWKRGTQAVSPEAILHDKDTAVVFVGGTLPIMAPPSTKFDLFATCLPQTQTTDLSGGYLMPIELFVTLGDRALPSGGSRPMAQAAGSIFVNPFLDPQNRKDLPKLRDGRILNGGTITNAPPVRLVLRTPDFQRSSLIQRRLNERFKEGRDKVANGIAVGIIEIKVPAQYRDDYMHFLELVIHLPLAGGSGVIEARTSQIIQAMAVPGANIRQLSLVLEAMGNQTLPLLKPLYQSDNPAISYYAAQTGLRLGDEVAIEVVIDHAMNPSSPMRMTAIEELGRQAKYLRGSQPLCKLLGDENENVRLGAYESLIRRDDFSAIERIPVGDFFLDVVPSGNSGVIYASQTGQPHIVLFGPAMALPQDIFFSMPDDMITINANSQQKKISIFRKIPRTGKFSETFEIDRSVRTLIRTLGDPSDHGDDGKIMGMGFSYGQTVGILYRLCKGGNIPAKFILQPLPEIQEIYRNAAPIGRPDMPEEKQQSQTRPNGND